MPGERVLGQCVGYDEGRTHGVAGLYGFTVVCLRGGQVQAGGCSENSMEREAVDVTRGVVRSRVQNCVSWSRLGDTVPHVDQMAKSGRARGAGLLVCVVNGTLAAVGKTTHALRVAVERGARGPWISDL